MATTIQFFTEEQVMRALHVSREAMQRFRRDRHDPIPFLRTGRKYLYDPAELRTWLKHQAGREE